MNRRWKRLVAMLGAAVLAVSLNGAVMVKAAELPAKESENPEEVETESPEVAAVEEESPESVGGETDEVLPAGPLVWRHDQKPGMAYFQDTNAAGKAKYEVSIGCDGVYGNPRIIVSDKDNKENNGWPPVWVFENLKSDLETHTYTFKVVTKDMAGNQIGEEKVSEPWVVSPKKQLPVPQNISWSKDGIFSCDLPDIEYLDTYSFGVNNSNIPTFGSNYVKNYVTVTLEDGHIEFNLNEFLEKACHVTPDSHTVVWVQAVSKDATECSSSEWSGAYAFGSGLVGGSSSHTESSSSGDSSSTEAVEEEWKPVTPDEIKRYAAYSREKVDFTADAKNSYAVTIQNAMQGKLCYASFEAALGDYSIGRTYNIFPSDKKAYKMDSKARITLNIPKVLQANGREFQMICVTENGLPIVLKDLDTNAESITFETDTYYAFALIYKDAAAAK